MKERPILFSAPMVRALLDGSKTQTRRVMKPQPHEFWSPAGNTELHAFDKDGDLNPDKVIGWGAVNEDGDQGYKCPYGQPGDRLWVRETWGVVSNDWDEDGNLIDWVPDRPATAISEMPFGKGYYSGHAIYAADGSHEWVGDDDGGGEPRTAWHPSIHMPRVTSRILLEIVSVRVERLQAITEDDARAEGVERKAQPDTGIEIFKLYDQTTFGASSARRSFKSLWGSINGAGSWDDNPWVWVVEFKRVMP